MKRKKKPEAYPTPEVCPYCGDAVVFTSNAEIYGREYGNGKCYRCTNCDAYVSVHSGTAIPKGRLADRELRALKKEAHGLFDPIWQTDRRKRDVAYGWLAKQMGIPERECHFGWFDKEQTLLAISILKKATSEAATSKGGADQNPCIYSTTSPAVVKGGDSP